MNTLNEKKSTAPLVLCSRCFEDPTIWRELCFGDRFFAVQGLPLTAHAFLRSLKLGTRNNFQKQKTYHTQQKRLQYVRYFVYACASFWRTDMLTSYHDCTITRKPRHRITVTLFSRSGVLWATEEQDWGGQLESLSLLIYCLFPASFVPAKACFLFLFQVYKAFQCGERGRWHPLIMSSKSLNTKKDIPSSAWTRLVG